MARVDEQALARGLPDRRERGRYFTPAALAQFVVERASAHLPQPGVVIDPACGAGAFLSAAAERWPHAPLHGLELSVEAAAECRRRLPGAQVAVGDALRGGWEAVCAGIPTGATELWLGNTPYNGTSAALRDPALYARLQALLPAALPPGTSLRDDYAFFLLLAQRRLVGRRGVLAFVTSASLLDAFLYAPVRAELLRGLHLEEVVELGAGAFEDTRVRTCVTVWTSPGEPGTARYRRRREEGPFSAAQLGPAVAFAPNAPDFLLRPPDAEALRLDATWRARGEPLSRLVPVSFPGLKTRFDELLVDASARHLTERVSAFLDCARAGSEAALRQFARDWAIPPRCWVKLEQLAGAARRQGVTYDPTCVRDFFRYAGARHRGHVPDTARAFCYLDRRLIPRGDHRFRGSYDPHAHPFKLVFNARELPLAAAVVDRAGCVPAHRHARFAPLYVPQSLWTDGLPSLRKPASGPDVVNLSERGRAWAHARGGPEAAFRALSEFINSARVQTAWAPALGASRELWIPLEELTPRANPV
jgi:hypothetical protein